PAVKLPEPRLTAKKMESHLADKPPFQIPDRVPGFQRSSSAYLQTVCPPEGLLLASTDLPDASLRTNIFVGRPGQGTSPETACSESP
ncbi:hypothetical protein GOODEAATRI_026764, partial [Goodea atripinnis]